MKGCRILKKTSKCSYLLRISSENNAWLPICIHLSVCGGGEGLGKWGEGGTSE